MIDRMCAGVMPDKPHTVFRSPSGSIVYEEMFTRGGFGGTFSYLYHRYPTTSNSEVVPSNKGFPVGTVDPDARFPLRRKLYLSDRVPVTGTLLGGRVPLLTNRDITIYFSRPVAAMDEYFANGDADELWFFQHGGARLESVCGILDAVEGDYVWIPKGITHRWLDVVTGTSAMCFEMPKGMVIPDDFRNPAGQLRMDAPYTHRDFVRPKGPIATFDEEPKGPREVVIKKDGRFGAYHLGNSPMDVVGWDGFVYPFAFNISKYQPKTGLIHLPPTIHGTFATAGALICSFVPRVTDFHPQAIPCPYPHSSVDCDEVILYLKGNFTSRRGVGPGAISMHPAGIPHGPHPGAYEGSIGSTRTDETAVMVDTYEPLLPTMEARVLESDGYHQSWKV